MSVRHWQYAVFMQAARRLYRPPFRFSDLDLTAFKLGFGYGESLPVRDLQDVPFETMMDLPVSEVRRRVGISVAHLEDIYRYEAAVLHTREAACLDVDDEVDHGDVVVPDGPDSGWVREKPAARPRPRPASWSDIGSGVRAPCLDAGARQHEADAAWIARRRVPCHHRAAPPRPRADRGFGWDR